ncbi:MULTISPECIES: diacylglycerol kinase [Mycobacteriaceae]|uniref:NAD(P)H-dependent amine dehydrogenase family protein n=1 Tax=Mycobacteriaceae TaxID=1762 RepID=UPI0007FE6383|nr:MULTISPECIES: diacylglycerol kinase [Mycobacteriaceae]MCK0174151.1 diacylglycerol kinase [Mycolicibacterium sp. F2034L]OBB62017.1 diacylglycerol kinase [Mycobacterium sp. 852013-51886_SCH5428379]
MAIRVAHVGTGNVGRLALSAVLGNPQYELVALSVSSDEKVGRDAGELAGLDISTGIVATKGLDEALATRPDCVVYCAMGDTRLPEAMADCRRILEAGINVVGSAPGVLQYPWGVIPDKYIDRVETAAQQGNSSIFINGVDPGFANDLIPFAFASTCSHLEQVRCMEIADYATYDGAEVMFDVMGFGNEIGDLPILFQPGVLGIAWGTAIRQLAAGFGLEVTEIRDSVEQEPAPEDIEVAVGRIAKGTVAAVRFQIEGIVNDGGGDKPAIVIEHITRLREDLRPDWAQPAQPGGSYRVEIVGEPNYAVDICPTSARGDHNHAAIVAAAGRIVNAIPAVIAAPPGIRTPLDLPFITGKGLFAAGPRA